MKEKSIIDKLILAKMNKSKIKTAKHPKKLNKNVQDVQRGGFLPCIPCVAAAGSSLTSGLVGLGTAGAAIGASKFIGKKDKIAADKGAVDPMRRELNKININTGSSNSQIIPIILGDETKCFELQSFLRKNGFFVKVIRSPTVPKGSERIRISLTATMSKKIINNFLNLIKKFQEV